MNEWPTLIPSICGTVRRNPKFAPEANSIMMFGPGVIDDTKANWTRAMRMASVLAASDIAPDALATCAKNRNGDAREEVGAAVLHFTDPRGGGRVSVPWS